VRASPDPIPVEELFDKTLESNTVILSTVNVSVADGVPDPIPGNPNAETDAFTNKSDKQTPLRLAPKPGTVSSPSAKTTPPDADARVKFDPKHSTPAERPDPETLLNSFGPSAVKTTELSEIVRGVRKVTETLESRTVVSVLLKMIPFCDEVPTIVKKSPTGTEVPLQETATNPLT
jgi:hypothetical protein